MPTPLLSQSEAFTGMTELRGSSISMQFLSYLKGLTPLCENKPEAISLVPIRLAYRKPNPAEAGHVPSCPSSFQKGICTTAKSAQMRSPIWQVTGDRIDPPSSAKRIGLREEPRATYHGNQPPGNHFAAAACTFELGERPS
jgi:hypothetical protein